ncbi:MAG: PEP/pyruvate-binding domain-containing protein, partial [Candidatus Thiodiazotropha sp.]
HFGTAQDIEFAIEGSQLYFLQARPLVKSQSIDLEGEGNE